MHPDRFVFTVNPMDYYVPVVEAHRFMQDAPYYQSYETSCRIVFDIRFTKRLQGSTGAIRARWFDKLLKYGKPTYRVRQCRKVRDVPMPEPGRFLDFRMMTVSQDAFENYIGSLVPFLEMLGIKRS